jgi:uncharacterized protein
MKRIFLLVAITLSLVACAASRPDAKPVVVTIAAPAASTKITADVDPTPRAAAVCAPSRLHCNKHGCIYELADWARESFESHASSCESGNVEACAAAGAALALGEGVGVDPTRAEQLLARACDQKISLACVDRLKVRKTAVLADWAALCDRDIGEACVEAGLDIGFGEASKAHTPAERATYFDRACHLGVANGCTRLAFHYGTGLAVSKDDKKSYELMSKACECGDDTGCSGMAYHLRNGKGVERDYVRAREMLDDLCARDVAASCVHLGKIYEVGAGVAVDLSKAVSLYEHACNGVDGNRETFQGCEALGLLYRQGLGVPHDDARAVELFKKACDIGIPDACGDLARIYRDGIVVQKDAARAAQLFDWACNHGDASSCARP